MKNAVLLSAVSALGIMTSMSAQADDSGWYLRGNAGYGIHSDADLTGGMVSNVHGNGMQSEGNGAFTLGGGYEFDNNLRLELDLDRLETSLGSISKVPSTQGSLLTETLMLNALYDFEDFGRFVPYLGAGLGVVRGKGRFEAHDFVNGAVLDTNPVCVGPRVALQDQRCAISDSDSEFGWQLLAGLGYDLTDNLTWDTHYTYLNGPDLDLTGHTANGVTGAFSDLAATVGNVGAHSLVTGFRYKFGQASPKRKVVPAPVAPVADYKCWDGSMVFNANQCVAEPAPVQTTTCWDGSLVNVGTACPVQPAPTPVQTYNCWDGSIVYDQATCPVQPAPVVVQQTANLNLCGSSPVAIFNVPVNSTPKQMSRLGTMPEFGDSHGLTPSQFYEKLNARYSDNATDKAYLNYLFKSMGYSNGWADAQPYMFSEEVLPVGTRGLLGLGKQHHYKYSILPSNDRDRQAFRIQSANGSVVHFMKTCGNYMYACE